MALKAKVTFSGGYVLYYGVKKGGVKTGKWASL